MKRRVLFVDDDPSILEGLRNRLHRLRSKWDMRFAGSGLEALKQLSEEPIDVIVSDMRMPVMDGAELLTKVRDRHPRVVRIVLSGHSELETTLRAVPVAHQFLIKPSEPGVIESVIERACNLQALIGEEVVHRVVGRIENLPSAPTVYVRLTAALSKETTSAGEISKILKQDMALCAKILQMVNSAFFRLPRSIARIEEAVAYLGFTTIKQIVLAAEVFGQSKAVTSPKLRIDDLQAHAMAVGDIVAGLFDEKKEKEDAFVAGLLHDVGKLVLVMEAPEQLDRVLAEMNGQACAMHVAEQALFGTTHAEVGGYLLGLWGLPYPVVEAVASHHNPTRIETREFGLLAATHIANELVCEAASAASAAEDPTADAPYLGYVEELGMMDRLPAWREAVKRRLQREP
jgi:HD-like signal output (HDOD) protein/CheY-like chemotaxis protein